MSGYRESEIRDVLNAGPAEDETWFRLNVIGAKRSKTLNVSAAELERFAALLAANDENS